MSDWGRYAAAIAIAYLIFTTIRGNLRVWLEIIGLKPITPNGKFQE